MIAQEEENKHKTDKHELNEAENAEKDTNYDADNEEYNDDIPLATDVQFNVAGDENKEPGTETIQPSNEKGNDNEGYTENDEKLRLGDEQQPKDKDKAKEEDEKCLHVENGEMKEVSSEEKENEGDKEQQMERSKPKENKVEEHNPEDGNNNFNTKEDSGKKERIRRARFSSEVRIEPKAYFQAGTDAVVTLVSLPWICVHLQAEYQRSRQKFAKWEKFLFSAFGRSDSNMWDVVRPEKRMTKNTSR